MPNRFLAGNIAARGDRKTLKVSAAETSSTTHAVITASESSVLYVEVTQTTGSGTPTMTIVVEGSNDGVNWFQHGVVGASGTYSVGTTAPAPTNFTQLTSGTTRACFPAMEYNRTRSVVAGGSPSLTYSVAAEIN